MSSRILRASAALLALGLAVGVSAPASASQPSTPNINLALVNPASTGKHLALTAFSDSDGADHGSLVFRDRDEGVSLNGLDLHRLWVPALSEHEEAPVAMSESGGCSDEDSGVLKVRGVTTQRGVGQVQVWVDVRPGHEGTTMARVRVRPRTDTGCGGHDEIAPMAHDDAGHGGWSYNSGWFELQVANVHQRHQ